MSEQLVYCGLRCVGVVRTVDRQFEAWAEPGREALGRFNTYAQACRAIHERDVQQREGGRP